MEELDPIIKFKAMLATDLGVDSTTITDSVASVAVDDPLLLHHIATCKGDPFMRSLLVRDLQSRATQPSPNSVGLLRNAAVAALKWIASGAKFSTDDEYQSRLSACNACEHRKPAPANPLYKLIQAQFVCELCGCDISKKARLATEVCPDSAVSPNGRWS